MSKGWFVVIGGVALGCAAAQIDEMPHDSESAGGSAAGGSPAGTAGALSAGRSGSSSAVAGSASTAGAATGGASAGSAGASHGGTGTGGASGSSAGGSGGSGGSSTKPANTGLPFTEDFEDGEANGFIPWNSDMTAGPWAVVADGAGKIYQPQAAVSGLEFAVGGSSTWTDVAFTVKVRLNTASSGAQIVLRFKDSKNYLFVEMGTSKFKLRGRANGSSTDLVAPSTKPTIVASTWYTVGITAKGTAVSLTLDGMPIGSPAMCDVAISNGGVALGVASGSVSFDDVKVVVAP